MDRGPRRAAVLAAALAAGAAVAVAQTAQVPLRAMNWLAPGVDPARALTTTPAECLARPADPQAALSVEVGRAAFGAPVLLGGQAARAGLSCESCHRAGRDNPDFLFPGISGPAGTADVTSSLFSSHRGDGIDDPKPIPDLGGPKARLKVSQAPADAALEPFIRGLVVEEFDGPSPSPSVLAGLAAYVRALGPEHCSAQAARPLTAAMMMDDVRRAMAASRPLASRGDRAGALAMVAAARARLGLIDERYAGPALVAQRNRLRRADAALSAVAEALRGGRADEADVAIERWLAAAPALAAALRRGEPASLFNPDRLRAAVRRRPLARERPISIVPRSRDGLPAAKAG